MAILDLLDAVPADLLCRPMPEIRSLQSRLLAATLGLVARGHPYYRRRWDGTRAGAIRDIDELVGLPVTEKTDFLRDPEAFRLGPLDDLPIEARVLREVMYTTGTTSGVPAPVYTTSLDHLQYIRQARRAAEMLGLSASDTVANAFPLTAYPTGGYVRVASTVAAVGATLVQLHTGRRTHGVAEAHRTLDEAVALVARHRATVLWGISSFVRQILVRAEEIGADLGSLRMVWVTGEATSPALRNDLLDRLHRLAGPAATLSDRYGSTEGTTLVECSARQGWHNPAPDQVLLEVVDPDEYRAVPDGLPGLLLVTHLLRTGTVLVRYALGDIVVMDRSPCACGRTSERVVGAPRRTGDIFKLKGTLVSRAALVAAAGSIPGVHEYQYVVRARDALDSLSPDELVLRLAVATDDRERVRETAVRLVREAAHVVPSIEFVEPSEIFDPSREIKPRRIVDRRDSEVAT